jgi:hypothetical protein
VTQALCHRPALAQARADGADEVQLADYRGIPGRRERHGSARSRGRRATRRPAAPASQIRGAAARKSARLNPTAPIMARDIEIVEGAGTFRDP